MKSSRRLPSIQQLFARRNGNFAAIRVIRHAGYAVAALLLFVAVFLAVSGIFRPNESRFERKQLSTSRAPVKLDPQSNAAAMLTSALPSSREVPVHLRNLYAAADKAKVELTIAEYRTRAQPAGWLLYSVAGNYGRKRFRAHSTYVDRRHDAQPHP